jgi:hypothetical protein
LCALLADANSVRVSGVADDIRTDIDVVAAGFKIEPGVEAHRDVV